MSRNDLLNLDVLIGSWLNTFDDKGVILYTSHSGINVKQALQKLNINVIEIIGWYYTIDNNVMIITN